MGYEKCKVLHFGGNNLRNGASYALNQQNSRPNRKSHTANRMVHLLAPATIRSARDLIRNPSNSDFSIAYNGSHVALSQHLPSFLLR